MAKYLVFAVTTFIKIREGTDTGKATPHEVADNIEDRLNEVICDQEISQGYEPGELIVEPMMTASPQEDEEISDEESGYDEEE